MLSLPTRSNVAIFLAAASFSSTFSKEKNTVKVFLKVTLFHLTLLFELVGTACVQMVSVFLELEVGVTFFPFSLFLGACIDSSMPPSEGFWLGKVILFSMLAFPFGLADGEVLYSTCFLFILL